ncbi:DUF2972 domain-containing protein [Helicobacter aurati]|nr:DUF2972 domain-containing protein [Helicobacter aurati]
MRGKSRTYKIYQEQGIVAACKYRIRKFNDKLQQKMMWSIFKNEGWLSYCKYLYWKIVIYSLFRCFNFVHVPKTFSFAVCGSHGVGLHSLLYFLSMLEVKKNHNSARACEVLNKIFPRLRGGGGILPLSMFAMRSEVTSDFSLQVSYELTRNVDYALWGITLDGFTQGKEEWLAKFTPCYKVPIICIVRDPILAIISAMNIGLNYDEIAKKITANSSTQEIHCAIEEIMSIRMDSLCVFATAKTTYATILDWYSNILQILPYSNEILYIDTTDLLGKKTKTTMQNIATFLADNQRVAEDITIKLPEEFDFDLKVNDFLTHNLPLEFTFVNYQIYVSAFRGFFAIGPRQYYHLQDKRFYIDEMYYSPLFPERRLFISTSSRSFDYSLFPALIQEIELRLEVLHQKISSYHPLKITPQIFLDFLSHNQEKAKLLDTVLRYELQHVQQNRPDIVATWEHYQEFQRLLIPIRKG